MTDEQRTQLLERLLLDFKLVLSIPEDDVCKDGLYSYELDTVLDIVLNYCGFSDLPAELEHLLVRMAVQYHQSNCGQQITQISRGDVSMSFLAQDRSNILHDHVKQLNSFRKLRW